ncbi:MAG: TetR/AcrR family transcriptional regulator [Coriobacteriales bacterium]
MPRVEGSAREQILDSALDLFSRKGYSATTVRDIAGAVGIKAASLYNHFEGKQGLFDALIERELSHVAGRVHSGGAIAYPDEDPSPYADQTQGDLSQLVWNSYAPFFEDERIRLFRHMLAAERYADERCAALYDEVFVQRPLKLQESIFGRLVETGAFAPCNLQLAAMQFHGPMLLLIERETPPAQAREFCLQHTLDFNSAHRKED